MNELLIELKEINDEKILLNEREKTIKKSIEDNLGEETYKADFITVSYTKPSTSVSIDLKKLEEKEPELYKELLNDYPKGITRKGSYRYTFK